MGTTERDNADGNDSPGDIPCVESQPLSRGVDQPVLVRTSAIALASAVCALAGLTCLVILLFAGSILDGPCMDVMMALTFLVLPGAALVLGLMGLISIGFSGGRRTGYAFAAAGIGLPLAGVLVLFLFVVPRIRVLGHRMECGTNLSGIGKAMLIYANDHDDAFPRAGGRRGVWAARTPGWWADTREHAYGLSDPHAADGRASIAASLYLLIKYTEASAGIFVCSGDEGTTVFNPAAYRADGSMVDLWDFGPNPSQHCGYAYQMVYGPFALTASGDPNLAILGDRNPWMDSPSAQAKPFSEFQLDIRPFPGTGKQAYRGNSTCHEEKGQSVMFLDTHVEFKKRPFCGLDDDNIYTAWDGGDRIRGVPPKLGSVPADPNDSLLVNDPVHRPR